VARQPATRGAAGAAGTRGVSLRFFSEVISELRRVTWPSRQETTRLTILVIMVSAFFGVVLGGIDWAFARLAALLAGA
jgi:preprotein translocase subunit SecE